MNKKDKKKGSSIITRSVRRNMLRKEFGNKGLQQAWREEQMKKMLICLPTEKKKKAKLFLIKRLRRTDPAKRRLKEYEGV